MPEQPLDNERMREWRRQLERGRLDGLAVGEDLPGPGAAAAARTSSRSASNDPRSWRAELERDRLSMLAMEERTDLPGPGAAGAAPAKGADGSGKGMEKVAALIQTITQKALPVLRARAQIYLTAPETLIVPNLVVLHFHKLMKDDVIKDAAIQLKSAARRINIPDPRVRLIIWAAPMLPSAEWLLVLLLDLILFAAFILLVVLIGFIGCAFDGDCRLEMGAEAFDLLKELF